MKRFYIMEKTNKRSLALFVLAQAMTLTFITFLQVFSLSWFIPNLLLMHIGIILFIISKKRFLMQGIPVVDHYQVIYRGLTLYLPIVGYKLLGRVFPYDVRYDIIVPFTLIITAFMVIIGIYTTIKLYHSLTPK